MKSDLLLGIDLGTSRVKTGLFDIQGHLLTLAVGEYPIIRGTPGQAEEDPEEWWQAVCATTSQVLAAGDRQKVRAVCVGGQGPTLVLVDAAGNPVHNALLWMDTRQREAEKEIAEILGERFNPFSYLPKLYWMKKNRLDAFKKTRWFMQAWSFINLRLSGQAVSAEREDNNPFPQPDLKALGLDWGKAPPFRKMGEVIGEVTKEAAEATGLPVGLLVVAGTNDGLETLLGAGIVKPGRGIDLGGTAGGFALCSNRPLQIPGLFSVPGFLPGQFILGGVTSSLGKSLDWYRESILGDKRTTAELIASASSISLGAGGLLFLPHLAGERSPYWDESARGAFVGLRLHHTKEHLARAILEASGYALRQIVDLLRTAGAEIKEIRIAGGQAQSQVWSQIKTDILGFPISVPRVTEAAVLGAAILAGVGSGIFHNLSQGVEDMTGIKEALAPNMENHEQYSAFYRVFRELYTQLRDVSHFLTELEGRG